MSTSNPDNELLLHKQPIVPDILDDIPGAAEENMLPFSATQAPLHVEFEMWSFSRPTPETPERLTLFWDDVSVNEKIWVAPINPRDLFLTVPQHMLSDGRHVIHYNLLIYNGAEQPSHPLVVTIDKTAPVLNSSDEKLVFPAEVITGGVTDLYLQAHDDELVATVPAYDAVKPGDVLSWFWDRTPFAHQQAGSRTLTLEDVAPPLLITFAGSLIREREDGQRYVYYQISDRAGNDSPEAMPVTLTVAATPVPRDLPWPSVDQASGSGEVMTLEPEKVPYGAKVIVPDAATVNPDEVIEVQWAEPGALGAWTTSTPDPAGSRRFAIPKESVAPQVGKQLPVSYKVIGGAGSFPSRTRQLRVQALSIGQLPIIRCQGVESGDLRLTSIPASGAQLRLEPWRLIDTTQRVRIKVYGVSRSTGAAVMETVVESHAVTTNEVLSGVGNNGNITIRKDFLSTLRRDQAFTIEVYVSFDEGRTWPSDRVPNFPTNDDIVLRD